LKNALAHNSSMPYEIKVRLEARKGHLKTLTSKALP
jgi:hypothetical protein